MMPSTNSKPRIVALDDVSEPKVEDTFTASNGLVFKLTKVSQFVIAEIAKRIKEPKVPVVYIEDKDREEENPNDPDYIAAMREFNYERAMAAMDVYFGMGTKVISIPDDMLPVDSEEWSSLFALHGIEIPKTGIGRYVAWLRYYALPDENDVDALFTACIRYAGGVTESQVAEAEKSFRSDEARSTD